MLKPQSTVSIVQKTRLTDREKSAPKQYPAKASRMVTTSMLGSAIRASLPPDTRATKTAARAIRLAESFIFSAAVNDVCKHNHRAVFKMHVGDAEA